MEVAAFLMEKIRGINSFHTTLSREWFETNVVLQVSLGNFLFFTILAILMIGVKSQKNPRDGVHYGGWMMKSFVGASWQYLCFSFQMESSASMVSFLRYIALLIFTLRLRGYPCLQWTSLPLFHSIWT